MKTWDVAVIGAGIVGCAIAREMKLRRLEKSVVMLEKRHEETHGRESHSGRDSESHTIVNHGFASVCAHQETRTHRY